MKLLFTKVIIIGGIIALFAKTLVGDVFLPGMQPREAGIEFVKVRQCRMCHAGTRNGECG